MKISAPAKVNLFFEVHRRRADGYHEIESLVSAVTLFDTLEAERRNDGEVRLTVKIPEEAPFPKLFASTPIPTGETNLVCRAAKRLAEAVSPEKFCGADIILWKRIPSEAGLGGGSSDAAATLVLLNALAELGLSRERLRELGQKLGCDVPLFLTDSPVVCTSLGESLETVPGAASLPKLSLVLIKPSAGLSTPQVYRNSTPREKASEPIKMNLSHLLAYWKKGDLSGIAGQLFNRLEAPAKTLLPEIGEIRQACMSLDDPCVGFSMTGSGSACFGLCRDERHAQHVAECLKKRSTWTVFPVETLSIIQKEILP
ncbi:MAG: 4-(cytidine 5'-diphospho)-2-C-methyl-D-erythritol kinase [Planctomycetia bacterium]|nr:4-(cytidine 5'-diphospho)-2-C-methyl-D-erythritol kinase [Planctomycetia bacterium]